MDKWRRETFIRLARLGFTEQEASELVRASATLHTWAEHECNGAIKRDEQTNVPYWYNVVTGKQDGRTSDREAGALARTQEIAERYGFRIYHQTDPRGCALYLYKAADLMTGRYAGCAIDSCYSSVGIAVVP